MKIRAKKFLWQNFLTDIEALIDISNATRVTDKNLVEVWPGYGALTDFLLQENPAKIDLVELDNDMVEILESKISTDWQAYASKIFLHHQDVLKFSPSENYYSLIANIPYYITSPILFHFLYSKDFSSPEEMIILMQKEVGEKILANTKKPHFSYLSLAMHQACAKIEMIRLVPSESFNPSPKVDSIVLRFVVRPDRDLSLEQKFLNFWDIAFKHPRKTLAYNLKAKNLNYEPIISTLVELGYSPQVRAEAILLDDWKKLSKFL